MAIQIQALKKQAVPCPHCNQDVSAAREAGHEYCPQCGFEFGLCRHCGTDCWETVCASEICCRTCRKNLHPDPTPLPDDVFWQSATGHLLRGIKFILALITGLAFLLTAVQAILAWIRGMAGPN